MRPVIDDQLPLAARLSKDGTAHMVGATAVAAVAAYVFQVLGGRVLGAVEFAPVTVLWTLQFLVFTVLLFPIEQYATRRLTLSQGDRLSVRTLRSVAVVVGVVTGGTVLFVLATRELLFLGEESYALAGGLLVLGYGLFALGRGYLAGQRRFRAYGLVTGAESLWRLAMAALILAVAASGPNLAWSMVLAPLVILPWWPFRAGPEGEEQEGVGRFLGGYVAASAASQTILAAGPLVVGALGAAPAAVSIFFVTFTLFRGPLTMGYGLLARVLPPFTGLVARGERAELRRWVVRLVFGALGLGSIGALAGWWIGPGVVALLFGEQFRPEPLLAALAMSGVVLGSGAMVGNQVLVALDETHRLAVAWWAALAVAALTLAVVSGSPSIRTGAAFAAGEGAALLLVAAAVWRPAKTA
jgi:O-antigen/teichoic acid export membrane protein